jgi:hypothetical protein
MGWVFKGQGGCGWQSSGKDLHNRLLLLWEGLVVILQTMSCRCIGRWELWEQVGMGGRALWVQSGPWIWKCWKRRLIPIGEAVSVLLHFRDRKERNLMMTQFGEGKWKDKDNNSKKPWSFLALSVATNSRDHLKCSTISILPLALMWMDSRESWKIREKLVIFQGNILTWFVHDRPVCARDLTVCKQIFHHSTTGQTQRTKLENGCSPEVGPT